MRERYDIRPTLSGEWEVIDTANGNGAVARFQTHAEALRDAKRRDR